MKPIARKDCQINGIFYKKGDEIKINDKKSLLKLNELGFIEPLTPNEIQNFGKEEPIISDTFSRNFFKKED